MSDSVEQRVAPPNAPKPLQTTHIISNPVTPRRAQNKPRLVASEFRLPLTAAWGDLTLRPGRYDLFFVDTRPVPVVVIRGMGIAAMLAPSHSGQCGPVRLCALFLSTSSAPPRVQLLRLPAVGLDLRFHAGGPADVEPGVLVLPLTETPWNTAASSTRT